MKFILLIFLFIGSFSQAYIPPTDTILEKNLQLNRGSGFQLTLKTRLENDPSGLEFREKWTIENAHSMRVEVSGNSPASRGYYREYIYSDGKRYRLNEQGELVFLETNADHFEAFFHYHTLDGMKDYLHDAGVLQRNESESSVSEIADENANPPLPDEKKDFIYKPDPNIRLGRADGKVAYVFGTPKPKDAIAVYPGLWIEQDRFRTLKLRLKSGIEIEAEDYKSMSKRSFPGLRKVKWRSQTILIETIGLDRILVGPITKKLLTPASLKNTKKNTSLAEETSSSSLSMNLMNEFYQRFR